MMRKIFAILVIVAFIATVGGIVFMYTTGAEDVRAKVSKVEKIERISKTGDKLTTNIYYLVFTDKGTYSIAIEGFFAAPHIAGQLKEDSSYTFRIIGPEAPYLGIYRNIVELK